MQQLIDGPPNDVPVITGNALDESGAVTNTNYTLAEFNYYNALKYGSLYDNFTELYPTNDNQTLANTQWNLAAQDTSIVGTWLFAKDWYKSAVSEFCTYFWTHAPPGQTQGAFHQSEIMYALGALYANVDTYPFVDADYEIQAKMSAYWANFAKTLNPNNGGSYTGKFTNGSLPEWAPVSPGTNGSKIVFELGDAFGNIPIAKPGHAEFIEAYFARQSAY